ncbi:MAG: hypothetical protein DDT30_01733 [Dehalococcoidia bacterium]|nr:hypothetical protein [Bacillota bacterium]MBT9143494.1 hypothetical protein [Bacillota bacterium]
MRNLPSELPLKIYQQAKERFEDEETGHRVAIKVTQVYGHEREVMVAYEEDAEIVYPDHSSIEGRTKGQ